MTEFLENMAMKIFASSGNSIAPITTEETEEAPF